MSGSLLKITSKRDSPSNSITLYDLTKLALFKPSELMVFKMAGFLVPVSLTVILLNAMIKPSLVIS